MFDTHQAARELNLPAFSLAYLLKSYCDIDANKQFQLADWRIRLIEEFIFFENFIQFIILDLYQKTIFVMLVKIHIIFFIFMIYYEIV
jgi:exosome complex exonuclease RRP6